MKILVVGEDSHFAEFQGKFGNAHQYIFVTDHRYADRVKDKHDLIFDFIIDEAPEHFEYYITQSTPVFLNTCKINLGQLLQMVKKTPVCPIFGFNGFPTLFNRKVLEVSIRSKDDEQKLQAICKTLDTEMMIVDDRVGLITPRVIAMIINEAYYTVQEKTATREDIDLAMKLGTNYPYGPFEWCQRIGIHHVYELLESIYEDTRDERYKICPLLKSEYLRMS